MNVLELVLSNLEIGNTSWVSTYVEITDIHSSTKIKEALDKYDKNFSLKDYKVTKNVKVMFDEESSNKTKIQNEIRLVNETGVGVDDIIKQIDKFVVRGEVKKYRFVVNETPRNIIIKIEIV